MPNLNAEKLARSILVVGDVRVDVGLLAVLNQGAPRHLTPKALGLLLELAKHPEQTVTRSELMDRLWPDSSRTPDVLSHAVRELRRALGDDARSPKLIETVHGLGYRLKVPARIEENRWDADGNGGSVPAPLSGEPCPLDTPQQGHVSFGLRPSLWLGVVLACGLLFGGWLMGGVEASRSRADAFGTLLLTSDPGAEEFPRLSPDGKRIAYSERKKGATNYDLHIRDVAGGPGTHLTSTPNVDEMLPAWSPDGRWIAYVRLSDRSRIELMASTGGPSRTLASYDSLVLGGLDWHPDGRHLVAALPTNEQGRNPLRLHLVGLDGEPPSRLDYQVELPGRDRDPVWSPDGKWIAFRRGLEPVYNLFVMPATGGPARRLTRLGSVGEGLAWSDDGKEIIVPIEGEGPPSLWAIAVEDGQRRALGIERALRPHIAGDPARLVFQRPLNVANMVSLPLDSRSSEPVEPLAPSTGSVLQLAVSPGEERVAYLSNRSGVEQLWLYEFKTAADKPFPHDPESRITHFSWYPDGNSLLIVMHGPSAVRLARLDVASGRYEDLGFERSWLGCAAVGESADRVYVLVGSGDQTRVARLDRAPSGWQETLSSIAANELLWIPPHVFARSKLKPREIIRIDQALQAQPITTPYPVVGWAASADSIWYLSTTRRGVADLRRLKPSTGADQLVRSQVRYLPRQRQTFSVVAGRLIIPLLSEDGTDIAMAVAR